MAIYIDFSDCNGCGGCAELCPEIFEMDEHGDKPIIVKQPEQKEEKCVEEAIALCPSDAILKE